MELRQLRYFVAAAEELHFGRAAARLRISTPTLSQQLGALERSLRHRLLDRTSQKVALTPAGAALLDEARLLLAGAERARAAVDAAGSLGDLLDVRVAIGLEQLLVPQLQAVDAEPALPLHLSSSNGLDAAEAVRQGRADAAFVWLRERDDPALQSLVVARHEVWLAVPLGHPLAGQERVEVGQLAAEPVALFPRHLSPGVWEAFRRHLLPAGPVDPAQLLHEPSRLEPMRGMLRAVADGRAVAPFVRAVAEADPGLGAAAVVLLPLDPPLRLPVELLWRAPARPPLQVLLDRVLTVARDEA